MYFQMAKNFGFTPDEVDKMDFELVQNLLHIEGEERKRESETMRSK